MDADPYASWETETQRRSRVCAAAGHFWGDVPEAVADEDATGERGDLGFRVGKSCA